MPVLNVALVGSEDLARRLGKKGDTRDIESYVHKESRGDEVRILSLLRPLKFPESIRPMLSVLDVCKVGLLEIPELSASLGDATRLDVPYCHQPYSFDVEMLVDR